MNDHRKTQIFIDMYVSAKKAATQNPHFKAPKEGSKEWNYLDRARQMVDQVEGEYGDFIRTQFSVLAKIKVIPAPHNMCTPKALERYAIYKKMKNKYIAPAYTIEGEYFTVVATGRRYPLSQVDLPIHQDPDASFGQYVADMGVVPVDKDRAIIAIEYAMAKLAYKDKVPTEKLIRARKRLKGEIGES